MANVIEKISDLENTTPMMQQYLEVKKDYEGFILMYPQGAVVVDSDVDDEPLKIAVTRI